MDSNQLSGSEKEENDINTIHGLDDGYCTVGSTVWHFAFLEGNFDSSIPSRPSPPTVDKWPQHPFQSWRIQLVSLTIHHWKRRFPLVLSHRRETGISF
ncbi:hypothetical protein NPIL_65721 [Nephila pilipes]|uniref:Uncharacterized protein n=1 Tax=Nephila pilipes TaxID=299642 RepID=A0A8X6PW59_NEPPI|nr:hypothetical protein NPIL_65721 [Nephila pilipes]